MFCRDKQGWLRRGPCIMSLSGVLKKRQIVNDDKDRESFDDIGNRFINELDGADEDTLKSIG